MTTLASLVSRTRIELGDVGKSFVWTATADGITNRYNMHYSPLSASDVVVMQNNVDVSNSVAVEESTGVLLWDTIPAEGALLSASGTFYRYFTQSELESIVSVALEQHSERHVDELGRKISIDNLPVMDEYPVVVWATSLALYTLATDAAFDIDIQAPDGVSIPRSERYRQLMEMIQTRKDQYRELCAHLGIGMFTVDIFNLNRISKATGRLIPAYVPQQVDDRSYPLRVDTSAPTYGNTPVNWPTDSEELTAYQGRSFSTSLDYTGNYAGKSFTARLLNQRGSVLLVQNFTLAVDTTGIDTVTGAARTSGSTTITITTSAAHGLSAGNSVVITDVDDTVDGTYTIVTAGSTTFTITGTETTALALTSLTGQVETNVSKDYTFTLSLTKEQTLLVAERTYWSLSTVDYFTSESVEIKGGKFFTARRSTIVI